MRTAICMFAAVLFAGLAVSACGNKDANYANPIDYAFGTVGDDEKGAPRRAPVVTALSPDVVTGTTQVTASGRGFGAVQGSVSVGGVKALVTSWSAAQIAFIVPRLVAGGSQPVVVRAGGKLSAPVALGVVPAIYVAAPAKGMAGKKVIVRGANFGSAQDKSELAFGEAVLQPKRWSARSIDVVLPADLRGGAADLTVRVGGRMSAGAPFVLQPTLTALAPTSGLSGSVVTLTGSNFGAEQGDGRVLFGSVAAAVLAWAANQVVVRVPAGASLGEVSVRVELGGEASNARTFTVLTSLLPSPVVTSLSPAGGFGGTVVSLVGTNFGASQGASTVSIGGAAVAAMAWSNTLVQFLVPAGVAAGDVAVAVTVGGMSSLPRTFTLRPSLTALDPPAASTGTAVQLVGANFGSSQGGGTVSIGGRPAGVTTWTDSLIEAQVPAGVAAGATLVSMSQGGQASNSLPLTVILAGSPALTRVTPATGMGNDVVAVQGVSLGALQGTSSVTAGGVTASVAAWSDTGFNLIVPAALVPGTVQLVATVGGQTTVPLPFTVTSPTSPFIASLTPPAGAAGTQIVLTGAKFGATQGASTLSVGGLAATIVAWSDTALVAVVPAAAAGLQEVVVTVGGEASNTMGFTVVPVLAGLTPAFGVTGTLITLTGSGFGGAADRVLVGGGDATITAWSPTTVTAVVPGALALGAHAVQIVVNGQSTQALAFTVTAAAPPAIAAVTPASGAAGGRIAVAGAGFGSVQGASTLTLGAFALTPVSWSDAGVVFDVPATAAAGAATLLVTVDGQASNAAGFTVVPSISGLAPSGGAAGARVVLTGANLGGAPGTLAFGGRAVSPVAWSNAVVTFDVPSAMPAGAAPVVVTAGGQPSNAATFTVTVPGAPAIATLSPASGTASTVVTISGGGFGAVQGASTLSFGAAAVTPSTWSESTISFTVPAVAAGSYAVGLTVGGQASNGVPFTLTAPGAPVITAVTPSSGAPATYLALSGVGFGSVQGASTLTIGGVAVTPAAWSDTAIEAVVPGGLAAGDQPVVVTVGALASNTAIFTVRRAVLSGMAPASGAAGSAVAVAGSGLGAVQGTSTLTVGGVAAAVSSWSDAAIAAVIPADLGTGVHAVVAWVAGQPSNALSYTVSVAPAPSIAQVTPSVAAAGAIVTLTGSGFGSTQGASTITFAGVALSVLTWANGAVEVQIPAAVAAGSGPLVVTVGGQASNAADLTVVPTLIGAAPAAGYAGAQITLTGANLGAVVGASTLRFGTQSVISTSWSMTAVTFTVPSVAPGSYAVSVWVGGQQSNAVSVELLAPAAPVIAALAPVAGAVGSVVTLTGSGFGPVQGASTLSIGGVGVTPTAWAATSIAFTVPALADGTHDVVVNVGALPSNAVGFTVTSPASPQLVAITPLVGSAGTVLTLTGSGLGAFQSASSVALGTTALTVLAWNDTTIVAAVPSSAPSGVQALTATVGGSQSNALAFTVRPQLTAVTPTAGPTGSIVVISGWGFGAAQGASQVLIGGGAATVTAWSAAAVTAVVPGGLSAGAQSVAVEVGGQSSNALSFVVIATPAPVISGVSPAAAPAGAVVTISGSGFGSISGASTLALGATPLVPASWSDNAVTFVVPAAAAPGTANLTLTVAGQASNLAPFVVVPAILAAAPTGGPAGTRIVLDGTNFGALAGTLSMGGVAVVPVAWDAGSVAFDIPLGLAAGAQAVVLTAGGQSSNMVYVTVTAVGAPALTGLAPVSGLAGAIVTATGFNFGATQGASAVNFGATTALVASWSASSVAFTAPTVAPGTYAVAIAVGGQTSNAIDFAVTAPTSPMISAVTPALGSAGMLVSVAGVNFGASQGASTLALGGMGLTPTSWSATALSFVVPAGLAPGAQSLQVTVGGLASNAAVFTVRSAALASLSPAGGPAGTVVTALGSGFGAVQSTSSLAIGGLNVAPLAWYDTAVTFSVPSTLGPGAQPVAVTVGGQASNALDFTVSGVAAPFISSVTPASGSGDSLVTVGGLRFGAIQGTSTVTLGGAAVLVETWSNTALSFRVPATLKAGAVSVVVMVDGQASNAVNFTVTPTLTVLTPEAGEVGATITVTGSNFGGAPDDSRIAFGGFAAAIVAWSSTAVTFSVPGTAPAGAAAVFATVGGQPSNALTFTVTVPGVPVISSLTPAAGPVSTSVVIAGAGFGAVPGASTLTIGGVTVTPLAWSDTSLTAEVPAGLSAGAQEVIVTVSGQPSNSATFTVTVPTAPMIAALAPNQGPAGTLVTLTGANFKGTQGTNTLRFGGVAVTALAWSDGSIVANVPASLAPGLHGVTVSIDGVNSNTLDFAVRPQLDAVAPSGAPAGVVVTLTGTGFGAAQGTSLVTFDGAVAAVAAWSASSVAVTVPASALQGVRMVVVNVNGQPSNAVAFTVLSASAPYVVGVSPASGSTGAALTLSGVNFGVTQDVSTVSVGGQGAVVTAWSDTSVTITVPAGLAVGAHAVSMTVGGEPSNPASFWVLPSITLVSPLAASGGDTVTLTGTSFGASQASSTLALGGVGLAAVGWSDTSIAFLVPAGITAGTHTLSLVVGGFAANAVTVGVQPRVDSLLPATVAVGASVTLTGTNFGSTQGAATLTVGGVAPTVTAWSAVSITLIVPAVAGGLQPVTLNVSGQTVTTTLTVVPQLLSRTPATGTATTVVTLTGSGYGAAQGASEVRFDGLAVPVTAWYPDVITLSVPSAVTAGTRSIDVGVGGQISNPLSFTVTPTLSGVSPASASGGASILLSGTNFGAGQGASTISLAGDTLTALSWSSTAIGFTVPNTAPAGVQTLLVTVGGETVSTNFTVTPAITSVSPSPVTGGTNVTVTGTNFGTAGSLTVAGVSVSTVGWSNTSLTFTMPVTIAAQTGAPVAATVNGQASSVGSIDIAPSLYSLGATSGAADSTLTIAGANFGAVPNGAQVMFGAVAAGFVSWSHTSLTVLVPGTLVSGAYPVIVDAGGQVSNSLPFYAIATGFRLLAAETLDCDPVDGKIDHYRLTYSENAADATFEGYLADAEGLVTARWSVAGYANVRLHHGASVPAACGVDTADDAVGYLKFDPSGASDTGNLPDLTAAAALVQALALPAGRILYATGSFAASDLAETDKAGPYVYYARGYEGGAPESNVGAGDRLEIRYSEATASPDLGGVDLDSVFVVGAGHDFGAPSEITAAVWSTTSFGNDTLTVFFGSVGPTLTVGDTLQGAGSAVADLSANLPAATVAAPPVIAGSFEPGPVGPTVLAAAYYDLDGNGHIEHVKVTLSAALDDATFPGFAADALGTVTPLWRVAGYANVRLDTRLGVTGDVANDAVLWLAFDEHGAFDTAVAPDLTATADPTQVRDLANGCYLNANNVITACTDSSKASLTSSQVIEIDKAAPILVHATGKAGTDRLFLGFSENVWRTPGRPACGAGGELVPAGFSYVDLSPGGAAAVQYMDTDNCAAADALVVARTDAPITTADLGLDAVKAANATSIYDGAGNAMSAGQSTVILGVQAPYLLAASSFKSGAKFYLRVVYSEPVVAADALTPANYAIREDTATACADLAATPLSVAQVAPDVYDLETGTQCGNTTTPKTYYRITVANVRDVNEAAVMGSPNVATALGTDPADTTPPRLLLAVSQSPTEVQIIFSEPMLQGDVQGSAECLASFVIGATCAADVDATVIGTQLKYTVTPNLGAVVSVVRTANPSVYLLTHAVNQQGLFYNLTGYAAANAGVTAIPRDSAGNLLPGAPNNQAAFQGQGTGVLSIDDGPLFDDPFGDGTTANFAFTYANRVYTGPNMTNSGAFRFEADGANPVAVSFLGPAAGACPYATSFGISSGTTCTDLGPNSELGLVGFNAGTATVGALPFEILMVGTIKNNVRHVYFTQDVDTQLDWVQCPLPSYTGGGNTQSVQNTYTFATDIYAGISSDHNTQAPFLLKLPLSDSGGGVLTCSTGINLGLATLTNLGKGGGNPAAAAGASQPDVGIDAMLLVPGTLGSINSGVDTFYIANNGGVAKSDGTPAGVASFTAVMAQSFFANYDAIMAGDNVTLVIDSLFKLSPGRKGVPKFTVYKDTLFMARNVAVAQTYANQTVSAGGELWKCSIGCTASANWTRVFTSSTAGSGTGLEITNNAAVSLVEVNGGSLYVGFDNMADGARVYRTSIVPTGPSDFAETGRKATAACANHTGDSGALGGLCYAYQFLSSTSIAKDAYNYLYVTVGCTLATASGDGQTCDVNPGVGATLAPMKVLVQRD